jgi:hypothetical protein
VAYGHQTVKKIIKSAAGREVESSRVKAVMAADYKGISPERVSNQYITTADAAALTHFLLFSS